VLTSFFVRFSSSITKKEFEELLKIARRVESVYVEDRHNRRNTYVLIGRHWIIIAESAEGDKITTRRIVLPCESDRYRECVDEEDKSEWLFTHDNCKDISIDDVKYSTSSNEVWVTFKCTEESYYALFNVTIDPQHAEEHDVAVLQLIAKYFGVRDLAAVFRPM
jgi:hypothetical protein